MAHTQKKRLVVCCDGTWQVLDKAKPTNVQRIAQITALQDEAGVQQSVHYDAGVGTGNRVDTLLGGGFGAGLDREIREAYRFLCANYCPGDEIFLFGFSRGAYTVRALGGLINTAGILRREAILETTTAMKLYRNRKVKPDDDKAKDFRSQYGVGNPAVPTPIHFLGCWDTVGALGIPNIIPWLPIDTISRRKMEFLNTDLGPGIKHARHAVAVDERRSAFLPTPMTGNGVTELKQLWFPGDHGGVGGGSKPHVGLSDGALVWMADEAKAAGLAINQHLLNAIAKPDPTIPLKTKIKWIYQLPRPDDRKGPDSAADVHASTKERITKRQDYRPRTLAKLRLW